MHVNKNITDTKISYIDAVVTLIMGSLEGITTATIKEKTGLAESQIWNIVNRAAKEGKIKKIKKGLYAAA
jgi:predicted transcriptional regulator of viral defense system